MAEKNIVLNEKIREICQHFDVRGQYTGYRIISAGNVNATYQVRFSQDDGTESSCLLQKVNTNAFRNPVALMKNIELVTEHIRRKNPGKMTLRYYHGDTGAIYVQDGNDFWRMCNYIPSATYTSAVSETVVRNAGTAFGEFQSQLADFDITSLTETIPGFHNTRQRYDQLLQAVREDRAGRLEKMKPEVEFLLSCQDVACTLTDLLAKGELPLRVTHNDTKISNVLFDRADDSAIAVIDLDTVMPGVVGNDFGDAIRSIGNKVAEDSPESEKAGLDLKIFRAFAEGFLSQTAKTLTQKEIGTLAVSGICLTLEQAVRFLTDYLQGDVYYKIDYPEHNFDRVRCQTAYAKDLIRHRNEMEEIIRECAGKYR